jgi:hypothetical protein
VARNVIAYGLGHNDDPNYLMWPVGAARPHAFRSSRQRYFPLIEEEKRFLLKLYPPEWKRCA